MSDYQSVTETVGVLGSRAQLQRAINRYGFACSFAKDKDVLEVACGVGQGLGLLAKVARSVSAVDIDPLNVAAARRTYAGRSVSIEVGDAQTLVATTATVDLVVLFEAIYYLPSASAFFAEAHRVLRPGGVLLVCTANPDLHDFNSSPHATRYYGASELAELARSAGFEAEMRAESPVSTGPLATALRQVKRLAATWGLIPKTMRGKALLKRLVYGRLIEMPGELRVGDAQPEAPVSIPSNRADTTHYVLHCIARKPNRGDAS